MFPFKSEAIADKRTANPLRSEEKKKRTYFKSDWICFKANNSASLIGHRSSQTHVPNKNCLRRQRRKGRESRTRFNFSDHPDRVPQMAEDAGNRCFHMSATWRRPIADRCRSYGNLPSRYSGFANEKLQLTRQGHGISMDLFCGNQAGNNISRPAKVKWFRCCVNESYDGFALRSWANNNQVSFIFLLNSYQRR